MTEIIPSINVPTFAEVQERIAKVEPFVSWCHLDVTDGVFSKHETWRNPNDLAILETKLNVEVHLMVHEPEKIIDQWFVKPTRPARHGMFNGVKRVITHLEAIRDPALIIKKCHDAGIEIGFAINAETSWELLKPWFGKVDMFLILRVNPGASGQSLPSEMSDEIRHLRTACPQCIIEIDGGVSVGNTKRAVDAGANLLVAGSAIFSNSDTGDAIRQLREQI